MASHGRWRHPFSLLAMSPFLTLFIFPSLLLLACFSVPATAIGSAVLGIDLGTEYLKAALVKPGIPLEIVLTKDSKRKEPAAVAFKPARENNVPFPERFYGGDALALAARFPDDVYMNLKGLLGIPFSGGENAIVKMYKERHPALKFESAPGERSSVGLRSLKLGDEEGRHAFLVEELLAMQLKQIRANAEALAGKGSVIQDAVITYPPFYTAEEKRSIKLAAELAGLNVEALISDGLAVGLNYATSRTFPSISEKQKPEYHLVYNMGAGSTTATVLRFQSRTIKDVGRFNKTVQEVEVMGAGWDRTLGGDSLNQLIVDDMVAKFIEEKKLKDGTTAVDVKSHGKTMARLWKDAEKARQVLSANIETIVSFEGLFEEDINFKYKITRTEFEKLAEKHADRVGVPLQQALAVAGLDLSDLESVILHGGMVRTPFVQKQLERVCESSSKLRTSVNADEAAVFGAAFKGAALSPSFRVKDIRTSDAASYAIKMKWTSDGKERQQKLFTPVSHVGVEKQVTVKNVDDFELRFYQQVPNSDDLVDLPILGVETTNLTVSVSQLRDKFGCMPANITTKISVHLSPIDGLPEILSSSVSCEVENTEKKGSVVEDFKEFFGLGSKKGEQEPLKENELEEHESSESVTSQPESPSTSTISSSKTPTPSTDSSENKKLEAPMKLEIIPVSLKATVLGIPSLSLAEVSRIESRLAAFDAADRDRVLREEALNELEAFIYSTRDLVSKEGFIKNIREEQLSILNERLELASEWLYGEGVDSRTKDFQDKLNSLKEIVDPALKREKENSLRPSRITLLEETLKGTKSIVELMEKQIENDEAMFSSLLSATNSPSVETLNPEASSSTTISLAESSTDAFADLDDDPYSTSTTTTTTTPTAIPTAPVYSLYTPAELASLSKVCKSVNTWLETQRVLQEQLTEADDPVLTVADIDKRLRELERVMNRIYERMGANFKAGGKGSGDQKSQKKNGKKADKEKKQSAKKSGKKEKSQPSTKDEL